MSKIRCSDIQTLNTFQRDAVKWAYKRRRCLVVAPCGSGKSLFLYTLFLLRRSRGQVSKMLVVTKSAAMVAVHKANVAKLSITEIKGQDDFRFFYDSAVFPSDIYLVGPSVLSKIAKASKPVKVNFFRLLGMCGILAIDEIHNYKNYKSAQSVCLRQMTDWYQKRVDGDSGSVFTVVGMTATPVSRSLEDYYSLFAYIEPRLFGRYDAFLDRYCVTDERRAYVGGRVYGRNGSRGIRKSATFREIVGYKNQDELFRVLDPYKYETAESEFTVSFRYLYYDLDDSERDAYNKAIKGKGLDKAYCVVLDGGDELYRDGPDILYLWGTRKAVRVDALRAGVAIDVDGVQRIVADVDTRDKDGTFTARMVAAQRVASIAKEKMSALLSLFPDGSDGGLVFCSYLDTVDEVRDFLASSLKGRRVVAITGDVSDRDSVIATLKSSDIVVGTRAVSESVDFERHHRLVFFEGAAVSTPKAAVQTLGRVTRHSSAYRDVEIVAFVRRCSVEDYFCNRLSFLMRQLDGNLYQHTFPYTDSLDGVDPSAVTVRLLKDKLLWRTA